MSQQYENCVYFFTGSRETFLKKLGFVWILCFFKENGVCLICGCDSSFLILVDSASTEISGSLSHVLIIIH